MDIIELILMLMEGNARNQLRFLPEMALMTSDAALRQLRTVQLNIGRGVGYTTAIARWAQDEDVVIAPNARSALDLRAIAVNDPYVSDVFSLKHGLSAEIVWVDQASRYTRHHLDSIYRFAETSGAAQVILLG